jgi:anti-sigma factor RsiW
MSSSRQLKLMAYADGELDDAERAEVEAWLAQDVDAVRFANDIANLGSIVKDGHSASPDAKAVASFDIADAVMAKVASEPSPAKSNVVQLKAARRTKVVGGIAAALALAASVVLMTRHKDEVPMAQQTPITVQPEQGSGVDVDDPGRSVSVFYLPNETSATTSTSVVVWVDESGEAK